jgi:hypothetical protein
MKVAHVSRGAGEGSFVDIDGDHDQWYLQAGGVRQLYIRNYTIAQVCK